MSNARGERTRRKILDAAWELSSARGVEQILCGVTLREVAAAAGMTPSAVSYHFPTMRDLALAMVEHFVATHLAQLRPAAVDAVDIVMEPAGVEALAQLIRDAADANMEVLLSDEEIEDEWRLLRCRVVVGRDGDPGAASIGDLETAWVRDLAQIYQLAAERSGCRLLAPLTYEELALAGSALSLGLQHAWACRPDAVRPGLLGDVLVAVCSAVLVPVDQPGALDELGAVFPRPAGSASPGPEDLLADAADVAQLFISGWDVPALGQVSVALGCAPEEVVHRFGSIRRVAAMGFGRHLPRIDAAVLRRGSAPPELRLADGLHELARCVTADRGCAAALLAERLDENDDGAFRGRDPRVRDVVPVSAGLRQPLGELLGTFGPECEDLAEVMVDLVLGYCVTHSQVALSTLTDVAMRLVPQLPSAR